MSNKVCVSNETEDLNLSTFNKIKGINESKTLTKHISCKCKFRFDEKNVTQINDRIMINVNVGVKNVIYMKKIMFGILLHVIMKIKKSEQVLWTIQRLRVMKL